MRRIAVLLLPLLLLLIACSTEDKRGIANLTDACRPGTVNVCTCSGKDSGVQICNDVGDAYSDCDCALRFDSQLCVGVTSPEEEIRCVTAKPRCRIFPNELGTYLNGVPQSQGGARVSSDGAPYQARFTVQTEDGATVLITVDGKNQASGMFAGVETSIDVPIATDGEHSVQALCITASGVVGESYPVIVNRDATAPDLSTSAPTAGTHYGPASDADSAAPGHQLSACATSAAVDAQMMCVAIGVATPTCASTTSGQACVMLSCPGGAPFTLTYSLWDNAGNRSNATVEGVSCAASAPSVQIVDPVASLTNDPTTRILSAAHSQTRKDRNALAFGAQYDVVACTDSPVGSAELRASLGAIATKLVATTTIAPAQPSDGCPPALAHVARFGGVTLTESQENGDGTLALATTLVVKVKDISSEEGSSPPVDVWIDSSPPTVQAWTPSPICDLQVDALAPYSLRTAFAASSLDVTIEAVGPSGAVTPTSSSIAGGFAIFYLPIVAGDTTLIVHASEPSGNTSVYPPTGDCVVHLNDKPSVRWVLPSAITSTAPMNRATDTNAANAAIWDGDLSVVVGVPSPSGDVTVTFSERRGGVVTELGTADCVGAPNCTATFAASIADGEPIDLIATTSDVPLLGIGSATLKNRRIDTVAPAAPSGLAVSVLDRRATSFRAEWIAQESSMQTYDVRHSKSPITLGTIGAASRTAFLGTPGPSGSLESITIGSLLIETDYYIAARAIDRAGNASDIVTLAQPARASFEVTVLQPTLMAPMLPMRNASGDINHDGLSDLFVSSMSESRVAVYFGRASGAMPTAPDMFIVGRPNTLFGLSTSMIGDFDGDGMQDFAASASIEGPGRVYVFRGRTTWPAVLDVSLADMVIIADDVADPKYTACDFGWPILPLGDYDGDGADDFAIGNYGYNWNEAEGGGVGGVAIVFGTKAPETLVPYLSLPQALGTRAQMIDGPPDSHFEVGYELSSLGRFYDAPGTTLVVGALPYVDEQGAMMMAFASDGTRAPRVSTASARHVRLKGIGPWSSQNYRVAGPWLGAQGVVVEDTQPVGPMTWRLFTGSPSTGLFDGILTSFTIPITVVPRGAYVYGGFATSGVAGKALATSLIGRATPDMAFWGTVELDGSMMSGPPAIRFITGETIAANSGQTIDVVALADVVWRVPSSVTGWQGNLWEGSTMQDANGDGYADLAIGEDPPSDDNTSEGRVLVLW